MLTEPPHHLTPEEFREAGYVTIDWIVDYLAGIEDQPVFPAVEPGQIRTSLPDAVPEVGEPIEDVLADVDRLIAPGVTHWQHPGFFGYFPGNSSAPAVLGELISAGKRPIYESYMHHDYWRR